MFIGHYGVSLVAKRYNPTLSLAVLFLAVQFLDVLFSLFVLTGVEKMRIVHGFTAFNPYDLFFMPYSYSLLGALVWSAVFAIGFLGTLEPSRRRDCRGVGRLVCRPPRSWGAGVSTVTFGLVLVAATVATPFMPDPPSGCAFAVQALAFYAVLALAAGAVDRRRRPAAVQGS